MRQELAQAGGPLPFAWFMERALYDPEAGYYEQSPQIVGRKGDFYTSVSVGPLLGELLGFQFADWLAELPGPEVLLIEAGAHQGQLAADLLEFLSRHAPSQAARVRLCLVEPSHRRRAWQEETLARWRPKIDWVDSLTELRARLPGRPGILYANELLDAFPVHRVVWNHALQHWQELGVGLEGDDFAWQPLSPPCPEAKGGIEQLQRLPGELLAVLPDGFCTELAPAAASWWREAAQSLSAGWLVTLDYGLEAEEFLLPQRAEGTLRTYSRHRPGAAPLLDPGTQDLTAHIHWTELKDQAEAEGWTTEHLTPQRRWLTELMSRTLKSPNRFPDWEAARVRQFQTLTHPEHLGQAFRVLVQRRDAHAT